MTEDDLNAGAGGADPRYARDGYSRRYADRIAARFPTGKTSDEDPLDGTLCVDIQSMAKTPAVYEHNAKVLKSYPGMATTARSPSKIVVGFLENSVDNILWLHDRFPQEMRDRASLWYDGANLLVKQWADEFGLPPRAVAGVIASLSPQKDWFKNISLAERVLDIHHHATDPVGDLYDFVPDAAMRETVQRIYAREDFDQLRGEVISGPYRDMVDDTTRAMWLRAYDEAHSDRRYRQRTPEGTFVGEPAGVAAWGSLVEIAKAISVIRDTSLENISRMMGVKHKVRSFYNNLLMPDAPFGDVTIDTHAVAAALLRPLSGQSAELYNNFGSSAPRDKVPKGYKSIKSTNETGISGTYAFFADAYRIAAERRGITPRKMQSIAWEAVRALFPAMWKRGKGREQIDAVWREVDKGLRSREDARIEIERIANGFDLPEWTGGSRRADADPSWQTSYASKLARDRVSGRSAGGLALAGGSAAGDQGRRLIEIAGEPVTFFRGVPAGAQVHGQSGMTWVTTSRDDAVDYCAEAVHELHLAVSSPADLTDLAVRRALDLSGIDPDDLYEMSQPTTVAEMKAVLEPFGFDGLRLPRPDVGQGVVHYAAFHPTQLQRIPKERMKLTMGRDDEVVLYHGTQATFETFRGKTFLSTSRDFAADYGARIGQFRLAAQRVFDPLARADVEWLFGKVGPLVDPYDDREFADADAYLDWASETDTWEIFEQYADLIAANGYDALIVWEGGVRNYLVFRPDISLAPGDAGWQATHQPDQAAARQGLGL